METSRTCVKCGAPLDSYASEAVCPRCLLNAALAPAAGVASATVISSVSGDSPLAVGTPPSRRFGDYELLDEIAHGGMGVVYRARQISLNRIVAVKMLLLGPLASKQTVQRFRTEAAAAASLQHPNIVAIHEVGFCDGQHFFAMDFVEGTTLGKLVADKPLPARRAATYLKTIAEAIQYAHDHGILHRDLKPSNVLIDPFDQPRVSDFGLAKRLEKDSELTLSGQVLGSPNYMPPEQAEARHGQVGPRSDVYSLGAILYHLLTARPPFQAATQTETLHQVLNNEPLSPRLLNASVPRDLETICLKCLEKEPSRRYQTAQELADDLAHCLNGEPIHARAVTSAERAWRWCRRKPALASFVAATALLLLAILIGSPVAAIRIARERAQAQANLVRQYVATGNRLTEQRHFLDALPWFAEALRREHEPGRMAMNRLRLAMTVSECPIPQQLWFHSAPVLVAEFGPDGGKVAVGTSDGTVMIWNLRDGKRAAPPLKHGQRIELLKFSPDGRRLLTLARGRDENSPKAKLEPAAESKARLWDVADGKLLVELPHAGHVTAAGFSRDGSQLATASREGGVKLWEVASERESVAVPETTNALDVVWSPDSKSIFVCLVDGYISRRELEIRKIGFLAKHARASHLALSQKGELLLSFGDAPTIEVRNAATGERLHSLSGSEYLLNESNPNLGFNHAEFAPDGKYVLGACRDATTSIWDVSDGRRVTRIRQIQHMSVGVFDLVARFSPDGRHVITGVNAGARVWEAATGFALSPPLTAFTSVRVARFSPSGETFLTAGADSVCRLWAGASAAQSRFVIPCPVAVDACAFSSDGQRIALTGGGGAALFSAANGTRLSTNLLHSQYARNENDYAEFSPDGLKLVSAGDGQVVVWDTAKGQPLFPPLQHGTNGDVIARFTLNGQRIITAGANGIVRMWSAETGKEEKLQNAIQHAGAIRTFDFTADGELLLAGGDDHVAQLWSLKSGEPITSPFLHSARVGSVAFSHDGRLAATADHDNVARIWRVPSGAEACPPLTHFGLVPKVVFSRDGSRLLTASFDRLATVWDAASGRALLRLLHGDYVNDAAFSPDERLIATASEEGLRLWDATTGEPISSYLPNGPEKAQAWRVKFSPDGRLLLACSQYAHNAMLYRLPLDTRTESEWLDLAAIISGQRVLADGRLESLTQSELKNAWQRTGQLTPPDANANVQRE